MTFEEEKQLFNENVVAAIGSWNGVEMHLGILFTILLTGETERRIDAGIARLYCAIENFRSKQQVVDTLAQQLLEGEQLKQWKSIDKHLGKRAAKRNSIIHGEINQDESKASGKRIWIGQPALMHEAYVPIFIHDLQTAQSEFHGLMQEILQLVKAFQKLRRSQESL